MHLLFGLVGAGIAALASAGPEKGTPFGGDPEKCARVGGDMGVEAVLTDSGWRADESFVNTPLPEGYPAPTPPGAIELKEYPSVRRAEVTTEGSFMRKRNEAFFPLFRHIQRRDIAMTSPVEMEMPEWEGDGADDVGQWTMAFLYRTPEVGGLEEDGAVVVVDSEPATYLSIGLQGTYRMDRYSEGLEELKGWLAKQFEWTQSGPPRVLAYNDPFVPDRIKWSEVQVPVERTDEDDTL